MKTAEIKQLISFNEDIREELKGYVDSYIKWVQDTVPSGLEHKFGVGIVNNHRQFGDVWGFRCSGKGGTEYVTTGRGYYFANDFNCWCEGSTAKEMREFAANIPQYISEGVAAIKEENDKIEEILSNKPALEIA